MRCKSVERNLVSYLYGEISYRRRRRLERHLEQCGACRTLVEETTLARRQVADLPDLEVPPELAARVLRTAPAVSGERDHLRKPLVLRPAIGFAVILLLIGGAVLMGQMERYGPAIGARLSPKEEIAEMTAPKQDTAEEKTVLSRPEGPAQPPALPERSVALVQTRNGRAVSRPQRRTSEGQPPEPSDTTAYGYRARQVALSSLPELAGKGERVSETVQSGLCATETEKKAQKVFMEALQIYNKAFQESGEVRHVLLRDALERLERIDHMQADETWQVLATALCADIYRSLGDTEEAVSLFKWIARNASAWPEYAREARYALFKVRYYDQNDLDAAQKEALALVAEASRDLRVSHVSLLMGDRLSESDPRAAASWYLRAREISPPASPARDRAEWALAELERRLADQNYILDWWVIRPFDDPQDRRLITSYPPEREIDLSKTYHGAGGRIVQWKRLAKTQPPRDPDVARLERGRGFSFHGIFEPDEHVSLYALTYVRVEKKTPVRLVIGSDDSVRCWVNDELVWSNPCIRGLAPGQDRVAATLRAGWNKILLKVANNEGLWGFFFQIVGRGGHLLWDLKVDPDAGEAYRAGRLQGLDEN